MIRVVLSARLVYSTVFIMNYKWCLLSFVWAGLLAGKCVNCQEIVIRSNATSTNSSTTTTNATTTEATTTAAPITIVDPNLPFPTNIKKLRETSTQLTLTYLPPSNYRTDTRYSHFIVEFRREGAASSNIWFSKEIAKTSNPNSLQLNNLHSGVLYSIRMRSLNIVGNRRSISQPSQAILARTKPPPIFDLKVKQSATKWTEVNVAWSRAPFEFRGHEYDKAVLTYYIQGMNDALRLRYPPQNVTVPYVQAVLGSNTPPARENITLSNMILGASYVFDVVMFSDGVQPTKSHIVRSSLTTKVPGPVGFTKLGASETTLSVAWEDNPILENITGYRLTLTRPDNNATSKPYTTTSRNITVDFLLPGALYVVRVAAERNNSEFGKLSEEYVGYARTIPSAPRNLSVVDRSEQTASVRFTLLASSFYSFYYITSKTADNNTQAVLTSDVAVNSSARDQIITHFLTGLRSGALYNFTVTAVSKSNLSEDVTFNSNTVSARTVPPPPANFEGSSARGTIYLTWGVPPLLYWITSAHYVIEYYPQNAPKNSSTTCRNKGQNVQQVLLRDLRPGTAYVIYIKTVAGRLCNSQATSFDDVTTSSPAGPITVLTQPNFPSVQFWKQITLNSVRVAWNEPGVNPEKIDMYVIDVEKLQSGNGSSYLFEQSIEVSKNQTYYDMKLAQGLTYRINVTTAVTSGEQRRRSMVVPRINSIEIKTWHPYNDHFLYPTLRWRFTTCKRSGRFGPLQSLCDLEYKGSSLEDFVIVENGIQRWKAPVQGLYQVTAAGAGYQGPGGLGATVSSFFFLKEGAGLQIAVGQAGRGRSSMLYGGAGATYVVADDEDGQRFFDIDGSQVMLVAGGAGSSVFDAPPTNQSSGRISYDGGNGSYVGIETGRGGVGDGVGSPHGVGGEVGTGGGAGINGFATAPPVIRPGDRTFSACGFYPHLGNGESLSEDELKDYVPLQGGRYERSLFLFSEGGFGGGGAGYMTGSGGGGGYSGGGGGPQGGYSGGGGSYIKFTGGQQMAEVTNDAAGFVVISVVGLSATPPVPLTFYLVIAAVAGIAFTILCACCLYGVAKCTDRYIDRLDKEKKSDDTAKPVASMNISGPIHYSNGEAATTEFNEEKTSAERHSYTDSDSPDQLASQDHNLMTSAIERWRAKADFPRPPVQEQAGLDSDSESTASSVSSMATGVNDGKFVVDTPTGKLRYRGRKISRMNSSFTGFESTDAETSTMAGHDYSDDDDEEGGSLPPPPPTPPLTPGIPDELVSEEQKQEFRQKLNMFHEMALRSRGHGSNVESHPTFVPSTNL